MSDQMNILAKHHTAAIPLPRIAIDVRPGELRDVPFLDLLQKMHSKQVGWMPTKQFEGKINAGHVLIAEDEAGERVGYCIGNDQYFKHDDIGIIYQMNVMPGKQRGLIGATLLKAMFDRAAYGCKLFCCWCAQDIAANRFWEACGFVPLAYRAGSEKKRRVHIFWQKRIRQDDTTTPWWFPSETKGGAMMEDRLVFPIPPGTHWSDAKPIVLPKDTIEQTGARQIEGASVEKPKARRAKAPQQIVTKRQPLGGALLFQSPVPEIVKVEKPTRPERSRREKGPRPKTKNNPQFVAAARELRDRWLERVNQDPMMLESPHSSTAKYHVARAIEASVASPSLPLLDAA